MKLEFKVTVSYEDLTAEMMAEIGAEFSRVLGPDADIFVKFINRQDDVVFSAHSQ